jgi:hypothetical protein
MSLPSSEIESVVAALIDAKDRGMSWVDIREIRDRLMAIRQQVVQLELCVVPHQVREREERLAAGPVVQDGNVYRIAPRPKPAVVPPKGGAA